MEPISTPAERDESWKAYKQIPFKNRTKKVVWIVSNCNPISKRGVYAKKLAKHIQVDIFGGCGKKFPCPDKGTKEEKRRCIREFWGQYKFYLSFENTMCRWYITEKYWKGYINGLVPIALGAPKQDYVEVSPPNSFIHVEDFKSPEDLAKHLHALDKDAKALKKLHQWREHARVVKYAAPDWCSLC